MKISIWLLVLAAGLTAFVASGAASAPATREVVDVKDVNSKEVGFFISGLLDILLRPLKNLLLTQINSIINSIKDNGGHIIGNAKQLIDGMIELIRPFIIRILDQINNIIGAGVELKERIRMAVETLFDYIGVIGDANKAIIKSLINYIVDKLLPTASELEVYRQLLAESPLLLGTIKEHLIKPILEFARRQVKSIVLSILDQISIIGGQLLPHASIIAELIRPHVIRILDIAGNLHGQAIHLREAVRQAVISIIGNIGSIGSESAKLLSDLIEMVTDIIMSKISGNAFLVAANRSEAFLIIDRIIGWIIQPILNKINGILDQIRSLIEDKTDEAKAKLQRLFDELTMLLKDPIVRIIGIMGDIGIEIGDVAKTIKRALEMIIDSVSGIHEANKAMFKSILAYIISGLLEAIQKDAVASRDSFDFSILAQIINRILGPITDLIDDTLTKLREEIEAKVGEAAELIRKAVDTLARMLAPFIAKIVEIFIQIGIGSLDLVENVRIIMELIINNLAGIAEVNKQMLSQMLTDLMRRIIDIVRTDMP